MISTKHPNLTSKSLLTQLDLPLRIIRRYMRCPLPPRSTKQAPDPGQKRRLTTH